MMHHFPGIVCTHEHCKVNPPKFKRMCEYKKHMDKHERPYKCSNPGCEKIPGFTDFGGLLRHEREIHEIHQTRDPAFRPHSSLDRSTEANLPQREISGKHLHQQYSKSGAIEDSACLMEEPGRSSQLPESFYSNQNTLNPKVDVRNDSDPSSRSIPAHKDNADRTVYQSPTRPITEQQLINEVKGIYAGLVMVEKKCVEIVAQQSLSSKRLNDQQWKALVALHQTLLQEHHDFFTASQHPTASNSLKKLAIKYAMPARMWRHGIHAFLELLRHRLPDSMEHMLSFIYLSYSMMALLKESVPSFTETWIECLGDLARYRMAIEDHDPRDREIWSNVARMWYNEAADKSPNVGRIQHHLAVLARPKILEQLFYYNKALIGLFDAVDATEKTVLLADMFLTIGSDQRSMWYNEAAGDCSNIWRGLSLVFRAESFPRTCTFVGTSPGLSSGTSESDKGQNLELGADSEAFASIPRAIHKVGTLVPKTDFLLSTLHFVLRFMSQFGWLAQRINSPVVIFGTLAWLLPPVCAKDVGGERNTAIVSKGSETNPEFALFVAFFLLGSLVTTGIPILAPKLSIKNPKAVSSVTAFTAALASTLQGESVLSSIWYAACTGFSLGSSLWLGRLTLSSTNTLFTTFVRYLVPIGGFYALFSGFEPQNKDSRLDLSAAIPCLSVFLAFGLNAFVNEKMEELTFFMLRNWERTLRCMGLERRRIFEMA